MINSLYHVSSAKELTCTFHETGIVAIWFTVVFHSPAQGLVYKKVSVNIY